MANGVGPLPWPGPPGGGPGMAGLLVVPGVPTLPGGPPGFGAGSLPMLSPVLAAMTELVQQGGMVPHATPFAQALTELLNSMTKFLRTVQGGGASRGRGMTGAAALGPSDRVAGALPMQPSPPALSELLQQVAVRLPRIG